ncbi:MAG TPA: DUF3471 domain-containing protein [Gemmatimonadaceae bacterium]
MPRVTHGTGVLKRVRAMVRSVRTTRFIPLALVAAIAMVASPAAAQKQPLQGLDASVERTIRDPSFSFPTQQEEGTARRAKAEPKVVSVRVKDTRPSLPLGRYAGTYADSAYGNATVTLNHGKLQLEYGTTYSGELEHWHFNTFRTNWRNQLLGTSFVTFALDARGQVVSMDVEGIADFRAVPDTAKATASPDDSDAAHRGFRHSTVDTTIIRSSSRSR